MIRALPFAGAALAGALVLAVLLAVLGGGNGRVEQRAGARTWTNTDRAYTIAVPRGWKPVADGMAADVLQRTDERGVVVIRRRDRVAAALPTLAKDLERRLRREVADFRPAGAKLATVSGRDALVYTFTRSRTDQVQSIVVVPAGDRSYTLDLVADGDAPDVARELAAMVRSFSPRS